MQAGPDRQAGRTNGDPSNGEMVTQNGRWYLNGRNLERQNGRPIIHPVIQPGRQAGTPTQQAGTHGRHAIQQHPGRPSTQAGRTVGPVTVQHP